MTASKPKASHKPIPAGPQQSTRLTDEQRNALFEDMDRRVSTFQERWRLCDNGCCRRSRRCLGPEFVCARERALRPWTPRQKWGLVRDLRRAPIKV